jgi:soluble lytic murein transglycosylase-like protein
MIKSTIIAASFATLTIFSAVNDFQKEIPQPVQIKEDSIRTRARIALEELHAPKERIPRLVNAVHAGYIASEQLIDPELIASIFRPESDYNPAAVSKAGYAGLMGTPKKKNIPKWEYSETNVVYGCQILRDKLRESKGNLDEAMVHYKGHGGAESKKYAAEQLKLYREVKARVTERMKG